MELIFFSLCLVFCCKNHSVNRSKSCFCPLDSNLYNQVKLLCLWNNMLMQVEVLVFVFVLEDVRDSGL